MTRCLGRGLRLLRRRTVALMTAIVALTCTQTYQAQVEVVGDLSVEGKVRIAEAIASDEHLGSLRRQVGERFPAATASQLEGLGLSWTQTTFQSLAGQGSSTTVSVIVTMRRGSDFDPEPFVEAARAIIEAEVRSASALEASKPPRRDLPAGPVHQR